MEFNKNEAMWLYLLIKNARDTFLLREGDTREHLIGALAFAVKVT
jgi:hypothetical protein